MEATLMTQRSQNRKTTVPAWHVITHTYNYPDNALRTHLCVTLQQSRYKSTQKLLVAVCISISHVPPHFIQSTISQLTIVGRLFESYKFCEWTKKEVRGNYFHECTLVMLRPLFLCRSIIVFSISAQHENSVWPINVRLQYSQSLFTNA